MTPAEPTLTQRSLQVWDLPTRVFHWSLLLLILISWFSGGEEDLNFVHRTSGVILAGLIVFRVLWGFVGGEHARFRTFFPSPAGTFRHLKQVVAGTPERHLGHNPVGSLAVFLLLAAVSACVLTGLFSSDDGLSGPFADIFGFELSDAHEFSFRILQALVVLHLLGVAAESWMTKDALVPAMITGKKTRRVDEQGADAKKASLPALFLALCLGAAVAAGLWSLPASWTPAASHDEAPDWHDD
jgi:cytochrome b